MVPTDSSKLVLNYAVPLRADERHAHAEALILASAKPEKIRDLFAATKEAATFYARFQAQRFGHQHVDGICKYCGKQTSDVVVAMWRTSFALRTFEFSSLNHITATSLSVDFPACHSMCAKCFDKTRSCFNLSLRRMILAVVVAMIGPALLIWSAFDPPWAMEMKGKLGKLFVIPPLMILIAPILISAIRHDRRYHRLPELLRCIVPDAVIISLRLP